MLFSCSESNKKSIKNLTFLKQKNQALNLSGKLYFVGPAIDSNRVEISADCDCCASDLAFINDSVFVYVELCLESNSYMHGKYTVVPRLNTIILHFDENYVDGTEVLIENDTLEEIDFETHYSLEKGKPISYVALNSSFKNKQFLLLPSKDHCEYAEVNKHISMAQFISNLKQEKVWQMLKLN